MSDVALEIAGLRTALDASQARAQAAEAELAQVRATVSCSEAMIKELKLEIAKLRRDKYGISSERSAQRAAGGSTGTAARRVGGHGHRRCAGGRAVAGRNDHRQKLHAP